MKKLFTLLSLALFAAAITTSCSKEPEERQTYAVSFQTDGGSAVASQSIKDGDKATRPTDPTKVNYTFGGWFSDQALNTIYDFNAPVTGNLTLYAKWIAASATTYAVSFESNGGSAVDPQTVEDGSKAFAPGVPTKQGYDFAGWFRDTEFAAMWNFESDVVTSNITLYAKWVVAISDYTINFECNGGSEIATQNVSEGGKVQRPTPPTKEGQAFAGWYIDAELENLYDFNAAVTSNLTLHAKWSVVSLETLQQLLGEAWGLNENRYTSESLEPLIEARSHANDVVNGPEPTMSQIVEAYEALATAIAGLVEAPYRAVTEISIYPSGIDGFVYVTPGTWFYLNAYGAAANGNSATDSRVIIQTAGLEAWAREESEIYVSNDQITFWPKDDLTPGMTFSLTIRSMDPAASHIVRSVTLKVAGPTELQDRFIAMVNALPAPAAIDYQHYNAIEQALELYWQLPSEVQEQLTDSFNRLMACQNAYWDLPDRLKFSFVGNVCTIRWWWGGGENDLSDPYQFDFVTSGAFPAGVYTERGWRDEGGGYYQSRMTLRTDGSFKVEEREANDVNGTGATPWEIEDAGTYTFTGSLAAGGVLYLTYDDEVDGFGLRAARNPQQTARRALHRGMK